MFNSPHWSPAKALGHIRDHGVETVCGLVRGFPDDNVTFYTELVREAMKPDLGPFFKSYPLVFPYKSMAKASQGRRTLFLMEGTASRRAESVEKIWNGVHRALKKGGFSKSDWERFLPVLVINEDWAYQWDEGSARPIRNGPDMMEREARVSRVLSVRVNERDKEKNLREAFLALRKGELSSATTLHRWSLKQPA